MIRRIFTILLFFSVLCGCTRKEPTPTSGIQTIDNITHKTSTYFNYGFSFFKAELVSNLNKQECDIVLYVNNDNPVNRLTFQANNLKPSFYKVGVFADEDAAKLVFNNLKTFSAGVWEDMADPIEPNQVWLYRSGTECYTKIRIISIVNETRLGAVYGECTFQWVYQPDGSSTFPGK
jgi:hypothetical protein